MSSIRVTTGSRLHFGLLRLPPSPDWTDDGLRYYGGAGLMITEPRTVVRIESALEWSATGPLADRALSAAARYLAAFDSDARFANDVERAPPEHVGLGTGTQLELAVACALSRMLGRSDDAVALARFLGRGRRSGVGIHGFERGGFLIDQGKRRPEEIASVERLPFPEDWRIVLVAPGVSHGWHGAREEAAFASVGSKENEQLAPLLHETIVPALIQSDLAELGTALSDYNARAGEYYRSVQRGVFCNPIVEDLVSWLRSHGAAVAGQSSWGPTVFAFTQDPRHAQKLSTQAAAQFGSTLNVGVTSARNTGADLETS
jgi:beta-RFAP synthase